MGKQTKSSRRSPYKGGDNERSVPTMDIPSPPTSGLSSMETPIVSVQENTVVLDENNTLASYFTVKNIIIVVLVLLLILTFLGVNILLILGGILKFIAGLIGPFIARVVGIISYTAGTIINGTANIVSNTAKTGIDIADGTAHSVGNLLRNSSNVNGNLPIQMELNADIEGPGPVYIPEPIPTMPPTTMPPTTTPPKQDENGDDMSPVLDAVLNTSPYIDDLTFEDDTTDSAIQNILSPNKSSWCLVGNFNGRRGCVTVDDKSMCKSGQVFDNQADCLDLHPSSSPMAAPIATAPIATTQPLPLVPTGLNWNAPLPPRPVYGMQPPIPRAMYPVGPVPPLQQQQPTQKPKGAVPPAPVYRLPMQPVGPVMMPGYNGMAPPPIVY